MPSSPLTFIGQVIRPDSIDHVNIAYLQQSTQLKWVSSIAYLGSFKSTQGLVLAKPRVIVIEITKRKKVGGYYLLLLNNESRNNMNEVLFCNILKQQLNIYSEIKSLIIATESTSGLFPIRDHLQRLAINKIKLYSSG